MFKNSIPVYVPVTLIWSLTARLSPPSGVSSTRKGRPPPSAHNNTKIRSSVADPNPGSGAFLTPGSGMGRESQHSDPGSGMNNPDHNFSSLESIFWGLKYLNSLMRILGPGWRQFGSGMEKSRIRDKHPGSATLIRKSYKQLRAETVAPRLMEKKCAS
jgi:hypothetical protein